MCQFGPNMLYRLLLFLIIFQNTIEDLVYCIFPNNHSAFSVYNKETGKDASAVGLHSKYFGDLTKINFTFDRPHWNNLNSLETNLIDEPILDQRWEYFKNNRFDHIEIERILKNRTTGITFLSVRIHSLKTNMDFKLLKKKWYHLKSNNSGIYDCNEKHKCDNRLNIANTSISLIEFYHAFGDAGNIWKLHEYDYWYTYKSNVNTTFQQNSENCSQIHSKIKFSFYLAMCQGCTITIQFSNVFQKFIIHGTGFWQQKEYLFKMTSKCFKINFYTNSVGKNGFWAIGAEGFLLGCPNTSCNFEERYIRVQNNSNKICEDVWNTQINFSSKFHFHTPMKIIHNITTGATETFLERNLVILIFLTVIITTTGILLISAIISFVWNRKKYVEKEIIYEAIPRTSLCDKSMLNVYDEVKYSSSCPIEIIDFTDFVKNSDSKIEMQFNAIPLSYLPGNLEGSKIENTRNNKYQNLIPFTLNRVKLKTSYINASYIRGGNSAKEYILAQSPLQNTVEAFWSMIWQEKISNIVMISRTNENVVPYWPNSENSMLLKKPKMKLTTKQITNLKNYKKRTIKLKKGEETRKIEQIHYYTWNDNLASSSRLLLPFVSEVLKIPHHYSPVLFHCQSGAGPSATILMCDQILRRIPKTNIINVPFHLDALREERINAIENMEQYKLIYHVISDVLEFS